MKGVIWIMLSMAISSPASKAHTWQVSDKPLPKTKTNVIGMQFEKIPAGSMIAGRLVLQCPEPPDDRRVPVEERWTEEDYQRCQTLAARDSRPGFRVAIDRDFYIGKFEVTQSQWQQVMGVNPAFFQRENIGEDTGNYPVENVTWEDVQVFISRLNKLDGTATYRLPTEFEWEYAARAGAESPLSWQETRLQAWIQDSDQGSTRAVGEMKPNAWGLYDMLGNVWEWVADFHNGKTLPDSRPPKRGLVHVLKGGSFTSDVVNATWYFHGGGPGNGFDVGFRLVMEPI